MKKLYGSLIVIAIELCCLPLFAADIASDVRTAGEREALAEDGGFFEVGFIVGHIHSPLVSSHADEWEGGIVSIDFFGEYRKKGFFFELAQGTLDGLNIGYTLWQNPDWQVDFMAGSLNGYYEPDLDVTIREGDSEEERNRKLYERNTFYMGTGLRVTHYFDDYIAQYRLLTDVLDGNGVVSTLRVGRGWQVRNWNFFAIASAKYDSAKANKMWFGVEEYEATARYPTFLPESTLSFGLQLGVIRPITEKWVARGYFGFEQTPAEARESPLVSDNHTTYGLISVNRVF